MPGNRCRFAEEARTASWPWPYCRKCRRGPVFGKGKVFEPYFAPNLKERGVWDCADYERGQGS